MGVRSGFQSRTLKIWRQRMIILIALSFLSVIHCAPQYGGGVSQLVKAPAPVQSSPQVSCRTEYIEVWNTKYVETETQECQTVQIKQCSTEYQKKCVPKQRQECNTVYKAVCNTKYEQVCSQKYRDETEYYTETECSTDYKEDCEYQWEGTGNNKVWAPIQGTCKNNAYDKCGDVQKERVKQVPYNDCRDVPRQVCNDVPSQECRTVTEQSCSQVPYQACQNVPKQECKAVHKKIPKRVSSRVPNKVCDDGASYGATQTGGGAGIKIRNDAPEKQIKPKSDAVNFGR